MIKNRIISSAAIEVLAFLMGFLANFKVKTKYGALAMTTTPIIIIGGIYMAWTYKRQAWRRKKSPTRSMSLAVIHGGKLALDRLVHYPEVSTDAISDLQVELGKEHPDFKKLQVTIAQLEMSGKEAEAVKILEEEMKQALHQKKPQEAYEIEMLLVEMLIYKGDFKEAGKRHCLKQEEITDARRPLYKAIIHIMSGRCEDAHKFWNDFKDIRAQFKDIELDEFVEDFQKFEEVVKKHILEANKKATD
ncbi:hypothetical protein CFOL_v3_22904 [Cephalotus follicularis]|uniref:Tetratricopeptide repeat protein n=1 Tax=Cephalotus follicularis TaxID=3775 RepID=A0A1Q3CGU3_CEPFO|nr:hypothetical protein CFOL_v3_22904 [Cephalotus follicularis]